ncbi:MAG: terminase gpA endonuclease subunit [bacterium]
MPSAQTTKLLQEAIRAAIPDGGLTVSSWAPANRVLSPEKTNPERTGPWSNDYVPHLVEIMDCFTDVDCEEIILIKSSQIAGTEFINNCVGFAIDIDPGPMMYLGEDEGKSKAWLKEYFDLMVRTTVTLGQLVSDGRGRKSENTQYAKTFPGGRLNAAWATSPATVSSRPVRYLFIDERDAMGPTKEGDSTSLARARTKTFKGSRKIVTVSSPRNRLENPPELPPETPRRSPIEHEYYTSDRRKRWIPCPHCQEFQVLAWSEDRCSCPPADEPCALKHGHVQWDNDDPQTAYYVCVNGCQITEEERLQILSRGEWRAEAPFRGRAGFWISELYSTFSSLSDIATAYLEAKQDPSGEKMKAFLNTRLAEAYEERDGEIDADDLIELQEQYDSTLIPEDVLIIVGAVDVQKNRLELEIKGYGLGPNQPDKRSIVPQSWGLEYLQLDGDPEGPDVWRELEEKRAQVYKTPSGRNLKITAIGIDSSFLPSRVYKFVRKNRGQGYFPVRGANTPGLPLISKPKLSGDPPLRVWPIGTDTAKDSIANRLELKDSTKPGFCHFGTHYPEYYFKQLRAEKPVVRYVRGRPFRCWEKIKDWYRNEALDLFVYCDAVLQIALRVLKTNFATLDRQAAAMRETFIGPAHGPAQTSDTPDATPDEDDDDDADEVRIRIGRRPLLNRRRLL